uniref:Immunoglobulin heavy variable 2-3 n=1 Tax=Scophthalmus maximus TaxID=52904 RepID=A0A8D3BJJ1_SCOMX
MDNTVVLSLLFVVTFAHGVWSEIKLDQSPSEVKRPGETVKMSCIISGSTWTSYICTGYDRGQGEGWSGSGGWTRGKTSANYGSSFQSRFIMTEDVSSSTQYLEVRTLTADDAAVYFCARDATMTEDSRAAEQKPPQTTSSNVISAFSQYQFLL